MRPELSRQFAEQFFKILEENDFGSASVIVLNWHLRQTGRPGRWTGRGLHKGLVDVLTNIANAWGFRLLIVYTIHEQEKLKTFISECARPTGLVSLNPTVHQFLAKEFTGLPVESSQVPGFMTSLHTSSVEHILKFLPRDTPPDALNMAGSCLLQILKAHNNWPRPRELARVSEGIVVFGMISARHGTTVENMKALCCALGKYNVPKTFKVVIIGMPEVKLTKNLNTLAKQYGRLVVFGALPSSLPFDQFMQSVGKESVASAAIKNVNVNIGFNPIAQCRYAISLDKLGYRENASAMVNMVRAGNLLFSRIGGETDEDLIDRCARVIAHCRQDPVHYSNLLAEQQPRFRDTDSTVVGLRLNNFFSDLVRAGLRTVSAPNKTIFKLRQPYKVYYAWAIESVVVYCQVSGTIRIDGSTREGSGGKRYFQFTVLNGTVIAYATGFPTVTLAKGAFASTPLFIHEDFLR
ncbi:hypothetical protein AB1286_26860 [Trinickia sp. NRRL B-1857]|uniref:hypothetical protein n=1 Tax=Trinickia sp. NRRL B-1857 TaxID=3162879 RepID=UPI003D27A162